MPHLTLDYTDNLLGFDPAATVNAINQAMVATGKFGESDVKTRAVQHTVYQAGVETTPRAFVHLELALLSGRDVPTRKAIAEAALAAIQPHVPIMPGVEVQLSVETRELHRESYAKSVVQG